jgi:hypothetical protein
MWNQDVPLFPDSTIPEFNLAAVIERRLGLTGPD